MDQSNMPASSAPKAALIDKVRTASHQPHDAFKTTWKEVENSCNMQMLYCRNIQNSQLVKVLEDTCLERAHLITVNIQ